MLKARLMFVVAVLAATGFQLLAADFKAGVAQVEITPPIGFRMAGYFDERISTAIHDPLFAKAIVLDDGKQKIAMVFCDLVGVTLTVTTNARAQASAKTGIPVSHILTAGTHTHTGPLFSDARRNFLHEAAIARYGNDPHETIDYVKLLTERIVDAVVKANASLQPASLQTGITKQEGLTFNRRYLMKDGHVAFNPGRLNPNIVRPAGPVDSDVGILLVSDAAKKPIGGLTVFAVHADTVGGTQLGADYPFFLSETLKGAFGRDYISAFAAGTCGDLNHINVNTNEVLKGFEMTERIGTTLGKAVLREQPRLKTIRRPSLAVGSQTIIAQLQEVPPGKLDWAREVSASFTDPQVNFFTKVEAVKYLDLAEKGGSWPLEVQVFRLDKDTALVGLPCEIFVDLGLSIKRQSPFKRTIVMSICNDRPSYVPTLKAFGEGSYEISNARVKPGTGELLVDTAVRLLKNVR